MLFGKCSWHFGRTCCLHLQGKRENWALRNVIQCREMEGRSPERTNRFNIIIPIGSFRVLTIVPHPPTFTCTTVFHAGHNLLQCRWDQHIPLKTKKAAIFIVTAIRAWNVRNYSLWGSSHSWADTNVTGFYGGVKDVTSLSLILEIQYNLFF
jgi:hypothetical protein